MTYETGTFHKLLIFMNGRVLILVINTNRSSKNLIKEIFFFKFVFSLIKNIKILLKRQCPNGEVLHVEVCSHMRAQQ